MRAIQRTNQGGSVATFIIVGVILAAGLVGTIYFLKKHGEQTRRDEAIAIYDQQQADEKSAEAENKEKVDVANSDENKASDIPSETTEALNSLPATGSELVISQLMGICLLVVATTGYVSSRRNLTRSL